MSTSDVSPTELLSLLLREKRRQKKRSVRCDTARERLARRAAALARSEARVVELETRLANLRDPGDAGPPDDGVPLRDAVLIFNPKAGREEDDNALRLAQIVRRLRAHGIRVTIEVKTSGKAARTAARRAVESNAELVIVAAGDGTVGDVAAELVGSATVLGVIPVGTMNNLARSLGIPLGIPEACALIGIGNVRHVDAGRVSSSEDDQTHIFFDCAGVGMLAIAAVAGQAYEKRAWRVLPRALRQFFEVKPGMIEVELDGETRSAASCMVTISNAPLMGNKLLCAPDAKMDDGLLDVSVYEGMGKAALAEHFLAVAAGTATPVPTWRARSIRISAPEALPANADMNVAPARRQVEIEVITRALPMIVGDGIALSHRMPAVPPAPPFAPDPPLVSRATEEPPDEPKK